jgi:hypothetical protein
VDLSDRPPGMATGLRAKDIEIGRGIESGHVGSFTYLYLK